MKLDDVLLGNLGRPNLLGEMLVRRGQIRRYQLNFALQLQDAYKRIQRNERLGEIFVEHRVLSDKAIRQALDHQSKMPSDSVSQIIERIEKASSTNSAHTKVVSRP